MVDNGDDDGDKDEGYDDGMVMTMVVMVMCRRRSKMLLPACKRTTSWIWRLASPPSLWRLSQARGCWTCVQVGLLLLQSGTRVLDPCLCGWGSSAVAKDPGTGWRWREACFQWSMA